MKGLRGEVPAISSYFRFLTCDLTQVGTGVLEALQLQGLSLIRDCFHVPISSVGFVYRGGEGECLGDGGRWGGRWCVCVRVAGGGG